MYNEPDSMVDMIKTDDIKPFSNKLWLSSPTIHEEESFWINKAIETNWVSTIGENIDVIESNIAKKIGKKYAVALSSGTSALHLAIRLAGIKAYGFNGVRKGVLEGKKVFCSDMTFSATANPISYEGGEPVFIDTDLETWNMDPKSLELAFKKYPDVKIIVIANLYGFVGKIDEIREVADKYGAVIIEDAAESFGATYKGIQSGMFGDYSVISFNGNKIITGSSGGMILVDNIEDANTVRKWSTQSRENAPWYQHVDLGYNYRMSNIIAGIVRGQFVHLEEHIAQKKAIYERYREGIKDLPVSMNPIMDECNPNYWLSCMIVNENAMCKQIRYDYDVKYIKENYKSCPTEILEVFSKFNAEGRPIWKPMHMQPMFKGVDFISANTRDIGADIFSRGLCLPSDNKMSPEEVDGVVRLIHLCFE